MKKVMLGLAAGLLLLPTVALADSISPASYTGTIAEGESVTIRKTVTVTAEAPTTAAVDVFFLADTTASMGGVIDAVKTGALTILASTSGLGDLRWGVGEYKDFGDAYAYKLNQAMTATTATAQAGINQWRAAGGGDWEEANLYALSTAASSGDTGWRPGSTRIMVYFGDVYGHDPSGGATLASTISALNTANIVVEAIDVGYMDYYGQATAIVTGTAGHYYGGINASSIVATIIAAITAVIEEYSAVALDLSAVPAGLSAVATAGYSGDWTRDTDRTFDFDVVITGLTAGTYGFDIDALVDGVRVATESDRITVTAGAVPEPATMLLFGAGLAGLAGFGRRRARKK